MTLSCVLLCPPPLCSVPAVPLAEVALEAAAEPLLWDGGRRDHIINGVVSAGKAIEAALGGVAQDIEGVVAADRVWIVQARPQVLPDSQ